MAYHCTDLLRLSDNNKNMIREGSDDDFCVVVINSGGYLACFEREGGCLGHIFLCFFKQTHFVILRMGRAQPSCPNFKNLKFMILDKF